MLANPTDTVRDLLNGLEDGVEERVGNLHDHAQTRCDDGLDIWVGSGSLWGHTAGQVWRQGSCVFFNLVDHLLVDLEGVDFEVELLVLDQTVDALGQDGFEIALTGATAGVGGHHARDGGVGTEQRAKLCCGFELS